MIKVLYEHAGQLQVQGFETYLEALLFSKAHQPSEVVMMVPEPDPCCSGSTPVPVEIVFECKRCGTDQKVVIS